MIRKDLLLNTRDVLASAGFYVSDVNPLRLTGFYVVARRDNLLLIIPAIIGAELFGAAGALAGAVVGNAISDAVAGYFEGNISEFLHSRGIDATRTVLGSSMGKMSGCRWK